MLLASGDHCKNFGGLAYFAFMLGLMLQLHVSLVFFRLLLSSFQQHRIAANDTLHGFIRRKLQRRAQLYRLVSCAAGGLASSSSALLNFMFLNFMFGGSWHWVSSKSFSFLLFWFLAMGAVSMCTVYGYVLQLAESIGVFSRKTSKIVCFVTITGCFLTICFCLATSWSSPLILTLGCLVKTGRVIARKMPLEERNGIGSTPRSSRDGPRPARVGCEGRQLRSTALKRRLKIFTRDMDRFTSGGIILIMVTLMLDFVESTPWTTLTYIGVLVASYCSQWKVVEFLRPSSRVSEHLFYSPIVQWLSVPSAIVQWLSAMDRKDHNKVQDFPQISGARGSSQADLAAAPNRIPFSNKLFPIDHALSLQPVKTAMEAGGHSQKNTCQPITICPSSTSTAKRTEKVLHICDEEKEAALGPEN
uniref:Uncharacterized protein n=1 Tax=Heterosigma akashiwo TaxID=2829 RepID=A0A6V1XSN2_HETAK